MSKLDELQIKAPVPRPRRRRRFPWVPVVALIFLAVVLLYFQREKWSDLLAQSESSQPDVEAIADVPQAAETVAPPGSISAAGYLEVVPPGPTVVSALVSGKVLDVAAIPGQAVTKGQVLARLDTGQLERQAAVLNSRVELARRQLERQQAGFRSEEIDQAQAGLNSSIAALEQASADWRRSRELYDQGIIARQQLDADQAKMQQAQASVDQAQARLNLLKAGTRSEDIGIAEAQLSAANAELAEVQWEIGQCTLRAPQDGVVLEQHVQPGDWVAPATDNARSAAVLSIFDPRQIQAWVDVNQRDSGSLAVGRPVELTTDAHPERPVSGVISSIMPQANLQKNTVQVKIAIADPPHDFRPQLSVKVVFLPQGEAAGVPTEDSRREEI
jgi:multidrug resistance efflux pump